MDDVADKLEKSADAWREALEEADNVREMLQDEVADAFGEGVSMRAIADITGLHRNTVRNMLADAGMI